MRPGAMAGLGVSILLDELEANFSPYSSPSRDSARRPPPPSVCSGAAVEDSPSQLLSDLCRDLEHEGYEGRARAKERTLEQTCTAGAAPVSRLRFELEAEVIEFDSIGTRDTESARRGTSRTLHRTGALQSGVHDVPATEDHIPLAPDACGHVGPYLAIRRLVEEEHSGLGSFSDVSLSGLLDSSFFH
mmetsp:Transcript_54749/g.127460  ORF Transcript_54749/g.127460 Transcript_54749/m.127460 type:complete len:188 (+) Transcript_54749:31-594(+)